MLWTKTQTAAAGLVVAGLATVAVMQHHSQARTQGENQTQRQEIGTLQSDVTVFSFYANKTITTGEGGMLVSVDKDLMAEARDLLSYDHKPQYRLRFNYKMTDLQAALGRVQLKKLASMISARKKIAAAYTKAFAKAGAALPAALKGTEPAFYRYVVKVPDAAAVIAFMKKKGSNQRNKLIIADSAPKIFLINWNPIYAARKIDTNSINQTPHLEFPEINNPSASI